MIAELAAGFLAGLIGLGAFVHVNFILQTVGPFLPQGFSKAVFASSLSFSKLAFETIPAVFFFVPSAFSAALLPTQKMASEGKGPFALKALLHSFFYAILFSLALTPVVMLLLPLVFEVARPVAWFLLAAVTAAYLFKGDKKLECFFVFALSGVLGLLALQKPFLQEPLFPLLSGLFGIPALLACFQSGFQQKQDDSPLPSLDLRMVFAGVLLGAFSSILPALSPAFLIGLLFLAFEGNERNFFEAAGGVFVSKTYYDLVAVFSIGKMRSGAAAFASQELASGETLYLSLLAGAVALLAAIALSLLVYKRILAFKPGKAFFATIALVVIASCFAFGGTGGLLLLATAAAVGVCCELLQAKKSSLMGCLIVPSMVFSLSSIVF